jgi:hypothetical protein
MRDTTKYNNHRCLLLNADFSPLRIISWQRAIVWSLRYETNTEYSIEILAHYNSDFIKCSGGRLHPIPAVAKTSHYFDVYKRNINFSRKNIFIRDNFTCQYCGIKYHYSKLTYDHVIPKSKWNHSGSSTCWKNIVTACCRCNRKKGNKTPEEAGMTLLNIPQIPQYNHKYLPWFNVLSNIEYNLAWKDFLHKDYLPQ